MKCKKCLEEKPLKDYKKLWGYTDTCIKCRNHPNGANTTNGWNISHEEIAEQADTAAKATRIAAALAVAGTSVAAPSGLSAVGVALGVISAPAIVTAAPVLVALAGGSAVLSAAASLYSKSRRRKQKNSG